MHCSSVPAYPFLVVIRRAVGSPPYGNAPKKSRPFTETAGWVILPYGNTPKKVVRSPKKTTK